LDSPDIDPQAPLGRKFVCKFTIKYNIAVKFTINYKVFTRHFSEKIHECVYGDECGRTYPHPPPSVAQPAHRPHPCTLSLSRSRSQPTVTTRQARENRSSFHRRPARRAPSSRSTPWHVCIPESAVPPSHRARSRSTAAPPSPLSSPMGPLLVRPGGGAMRGVRTRYVGLSFSCYCSWTMTDKNEVFCASPKRLPTRAQRSARARPADE